jgi:OOP family OmpA-OmpF porin
MCSHWSSVPRSQPDTARRCAPNLRRSLIAVVLLCTGARPALAQEARFDLRRFAPPTDPQSSVALEPTGTAGPGAWTAGFVSSYAYRLLVLKDQQGNTVAVPLANQLSFDALFNVGLGERLALGLAVPAVLGQSGDPWPSTGTRLSRSALGDLGMEAKATLLPRGSLGGFGLAVLARGTLPVGDPNSAMATRGTTASLRILGDLDWLLVSLRASAGVLVRAEQQHLLGETYGHELPWSLGLALRPQAFGWDNQGRWQWFVETRGALALTPSFGSHAGSPAAFGVGARWSFMRDVSALGGVELPLDTAVGVPSIRVVFGISWAPRFQDSDRDGIGDDADDCPEMAEDFDGFEDDDGCPDEDNDGDGISDAQDACPNQPETVNGYRDDDGCPDSAPAAMAPRVAPGAAK